MLTKIELTNFQSHKRTSLEMGKLTMLTGNSNSGKSSVLRAIAGALRNDSAASLVTHGEKTFAVTLHFNDGSAVTWRKGSGVNQYTIGGSSGHTYDKVGADVPEDVATLLGMTPITMEDGRKVHVNLHSQLESPFLVSDTPGQVAKLLGELTAASKIFTAVGEGNRQLREMSAQRKVRRADLDKAREDLEEFRNLDEQLELLAAAKGLSSQATQVESSKTTLQACVEGLDGLADKIAQVETGLSRLTPLATLDLTALEQYNEQVVRLTALVEQHGAISERQHKLSVMRKSLTEAAEVTGIDEALEVATQIDRINSYIDDRREVSRDHSVAHAQLEKLTAALGNIDTALDAAYRELDTCPSCGQELSSEEAKAHILGEVLV